MKRVSFVCLHQLTVIPPVSLSLILMGPLIFSAIVVGVVLKLRPAKPFVKYFLHIPCPHGLFVPEIVVGLSVGVAGLSTSQ